MPKDRLFGVVLAVIKVNLIPPDRDFAVNVRDHEMNS